MLEFNGGLRIRVNIVLDELELGIRWERPSLILAVYRSELIKIQVQTTLATSLLKSGQAVFQYGVDKSHYDIPIELLAHPEHNHAVFFVSGLRWGGGRGYSNAYRALNMHREILVEGKIRAIFWLTQFEAKQLTRYSPDFWAFRHKVVEFLDLPSTQNRKSIRTSENPFHNLYTRTTSDFMDRIKTAEELQAKGCIDEAMLNYRKTLRIYPDQTALYLQIAEIHLSMGRYPAARRMLRKANKPISMDRNLLRELDCLRKDADSRQHVSGGFLEQAK